MKRNRRHSEPLLSVAFFAFALARPVFAEVKVAAVFSDHMVLQRDMPVPLWGTASPGEKIVASGPLYRAFRIEGSTIHVRFDETGSGLTPGQAPWRAAGVVPLPTDHLVGFFIAAADRKWVDADAKIDGDNVIVSSPAVPKPAAVRYGWANSPRCNLYNREGLPASPFRTDDWSGAAGHDK